MHDLENLSVLTLPGLHGAGPDHWQTAWEAAFPGLTRVEQADWERPVYREWAGRLKAAVERSDRPVILIAHSLGTSLAMRFAFDEPAAARKVAGAFLVAPTDRDRFDAPDSPLRAFGPMIMKRLPFASMVVASRNDDRVAFDRAGAFAKAWGARFVDAGNLGHIGSASKLGLWPFGLFWFGQFVGSLDTRQRVKR